VDGRNLGNQNQGSYQAARTGECSKPHDEIPRR
jgi:hypothetical protein